MHITFERDGRPAWAEGSPSELRETDASRSTSAARRSPPSAAIILADTKFEFGFADGELILIDEVLTPDCSRFWPADGYRPGRGPAVVRQAVRPRLAGRERLGHEPPPPELPDEVVDRTARKYREAYERLTGERFDHYRHRMGVISERDGRPTRPRSRTAPTGSTRERSASRSLVSLKPGLLDPQGKAVEGALPALGWTNVAEVRVGKHVELDDRADDRARPPRRSRRWRSGCCRTR